MKAVLISRTLYPQGSTNQTLRSPVHEHSCRLCVRTGLSVCPLVNLELSFSFPLVQGSSQGLGSFPLKFSTHTCFEYNPLFDNRVLLTLCPHFWMKLLSVIQKPFVSTLPTESTWYDPNMVLWPHPSKSEQVTEIPSPLGHNSATYFHTLQFPSSHIQGRRLALNKRRIGPYLN